MQISAKDGTETQSSRNLFRHALVGRGPMPGGRRFRAPQLPLSFALTGTLHEFLRPSALGLRGKGCARQGLRFLEAIAEEEAHLSAGC